MKGCIYSENAYDPELLPLGYGGAGLCMKGNQL